MITGVKCLSQKWHSWWIKCKRFIWIRSIPKIIEIFHKPLSKVIHQCWPLSDHSVTTLKIHLNAKLFSIIFMHFVCKLSKKVISTVEFHYVDWCFKNKSIVTFSRHSKLSVVFDFMTHYLRIETMSAKLLISQWTTNSKSLAEVYVMKFLTNYFCRQ